MADQARIEGVDDGPAAALIQMREELLDQIVPLRERHGDGNAAWEIVARQLLHCQRLAGGMG